MTRVPRSRSNTISYEMFGLKNFRGSCWVNAALQGIFRIPEVQHRYQNKLADSANTLDVCLEEVWQTKGEDQSLRRLFECLNASGLDAGRDIGDSLELINHFCDKLPFLDKLMRFTMTYSSKCNNPSCDYKKTDTQSMIDFLLTPSKADMKISAVIGEMVTPEVNSEHRCEKCGEKGFTKRTMVNNFPDELVFHMPTLDTSVHYTPSLVVNGIKYALSAIVCYNGAHWWTIGRDMPPSEFNSWHTLNDTHVEKHSATQYPLSGYMRLLMYYRIK